MTGVSAVVLKVTVVGPIGPGYLSVYPDGTTTPTASNLNFAAGETVANRGIVPVSASGQVDPYANQATNATVDVWLVLDQRGDRQRLLDPCLPGAHL